MQSHESAFAGRGGKGGGLTRRQAIKRTLAGLAGGVAMTLPALAKLSAGNPLRSPEQRAVAERILQREVDSGNVPGIAWSIGNTNGDPGGGRRRPQDRIARHTHGCCDALRARFGQQAVRGSLLSTCCATRASSRSTRRSPTYLPAYRDAEQDDLAPGPHDEQRDFLRHRRLRGARRGPHRRHGLDREPQPHGARVPARCALRLQQLRL